MNFMSKSNSSSLIYRGYFGNELYGLIKAAKTAPLRRHRILMHNSYSDPIQEMIVALMSDSHVHPHKHPFSSESYYILSGSLEIDWGTEHDHLDQTIRLDRSRPEGAHGLRLAPDVWHRTRAITECAVFLEIGQGPFDEYKTVYCGSKDNEIMGAER
jgi:cupin fold WbuC family metalloprotein